MYKETQNTISVSPTSKMIKQDITTFKYAPKPTKRQVDKLD